MACLLVTLLLCGLLTGADSRCSSKVVAPSCTCDSSVLFNAQPSCTSTPTAFSTERVVTCGDSHNVQRLSCDCGVIIVQSALYGRVDKETCSEGRTPDQLSDTHCLQQGTLETIQNRCNGLKECEYKIYVVEVSDPCHGIYKYLGTTYSCFPAVHSVTCEHSLAYLQCGKGQIIFVLGAYYGRSDQSTCIYGRPSGQVENVQCSNPTNKVAESCNGQNSCSIKAENSVFGDPCVGTYKYLEVAYICKNPDIGVDH